jgi:hypothetical protein
MGRRCEFSLSNRHLPRWAVFGIGFDVGIAAWLALEAGRSPGTPSVWWTLMILQATAFGFVFCALDRLRYRPLAMPRAQFGLKSMLWVTVCVACFLAGIRFGREMEKNRPPRVQYIERSLLPYMEQVAQPDSKGGGRGRPSPAFSSQEPRSGT